MLPFYQHRTDDLWGCGIDAITALDCWGVGLAGISGLKLQKGSTARMGYTPAGYSQSGGYYTFHFPDGNASIARLLVRALIPGSIPGHDARDIVTAKADYSKLDAAGFTGPDPPQSDRGARPQCGTKASKSPTPRRGAAGRSCGRAQVIACSPAGT